MLIQCEGNSNQCANYKIQCEHCIENIYAINPQYDYDELIDEESEIDNND